MEFVFFWLVFSIVVGVAANSRGRSGVGWFLFSLILSPLLGLILVLVLPRQSAETQDADEEVAPKFADVRCPDCRELVRADARKCKHCGSALVPKVAV